MGTGKRVCVPASSGVRIWCVAAAEASIFWPSPWDMELDLKRKAMAASTAGGSVRDYKRTRFFFFFFFFVSAVSSRLRLRRAAEGKLDRGDTFFMECITSVPQFEPLRLVPL